MSALGTPSGPMKDPYDLQGALARFQILHGKRITGISAGPNGLVLLFEDGYRLGPLSRFTGLCRRELVREEL